MMRRLIGIFLLSAAMLLFQVTLTRVLSVALWYHFGFLVISTALLGFGASGSLLSLWTWLRKRADLQKSMAVLSLLFAITMVACFWMMQRIPFEPFSILNDSMQLWWTPLYMLLIATPFFFAGLAIALLLARSKEDVNRVYAWDLAGAGCGCVAVIYVIPLLGGSGAIIGAAVLAALAGAVFVGRSHPGWLVAALAVTIALGASIPTASTWARVVLTANKGSRDAPVEWSKWDAFSRVDLMARSADPGSGRPASRAFRIDGGTAFTGIGDPKPWLALLDSGEAIEDVPVLRDMAVPLHGKIAPHVLVIGSGAGAETLESLLHGAAKVTALEINPIIAQTVIEDPFWGDLFTRSAVELHDVEGRSFLRRSAETYDAIVSVHTISNAAMAAGAMDLAENYVLTLEAFDDYLEHLAADGTIYFTRPEAHLPRLVATARHALGRAGITDPTRHFYLWRSAPRIAGELSFSSGLVVRNKPFSDDELAAMDAILAGDPEIESEYELLYSPVRDHVSEQGADEQASGLAFAPETELDIYPTLLTAPDPARFWSESAAQLTPATDDRPFFNHRTRWSAISTDTFRDIFSQSSRGRMALEDRPIAEVTLIILLLESGLIAGVFIFVPLLKLRKSMPVKGAAWPWMLYFSALGVGFILAEIVLIQWFTLFLGRPTLTFATVLATLLVSSGVGAAASSRVLGAAPQRNLRFVLLGITVVLVGLSLVIDAIIEATLQLPLGARIAVTAAVISPVGFLLGMPFPTGLRLLHAELSPLIPWAWAVNAFFTVIGSVLAVMVGMTFGFFVALLIAAACYGVAIIPMVRHHPVGAAS